MENETPVVKCKNCGTNYRLKKGPPELCWVCGMPTEEKIDAI